MRGNSGKSGGSDGRVHRCHHVRDQKRKNEFPSVDLCTLTFRYAFRTVFGTSRFLGGLVNFMFGVLSVENAIAVDCIRSRELMLT